MIEQKKQTFIYLAWLLDLIRYFNTRHGTRTKKVFFYLQQQQNFKSIWKKKKVSCCSWLTFDWDGRQQYLIESVVDEGNDNKLLNYYQRLTKYRSKALSIQISFFELSNPSRLVRTSLHDMFRSWWLFYLFILLPFLEWWRRALYLRNVYYLGPPLPSYPVNPWLNILDDAQKKDMKQEQLSYFVLFEDCHCLPVCIRSETNSPARRCPHGMTAIRDSYSLSLLSLFFS